MKAMLRVDKFLSRHMPLMLLGAGVLGVCFEKEVAPLQQYMSHMMAVMTFVNSLGGGFQDLRETTRRPIPILVAFVVMHLIMPALVLGIGRAVFPNNPDFVSGLVLQFTLPVGIATLMWVGMSGGHMGLCLSMVLIDTLLSPFTIPLSLKLLLGTVVEMDGVSMMKDLLLMVGIPALLAMLLYEKDNGCIAKTLKPKLALLGKLMVFLIVAATGSKCADFFVNIDSWVLVVTVTILVLTIGGFVLGHWVSQGLKLEYPSAFTLTVVMGFRNISAGIVLAQQYFPVEALLPVSIMPLFQQLLLAVVIKFLWRTKPAKAYTAQLEAKL